VKYTNWHDGRTPAAPFNTCSPNLVAIRHYMEQTYGMWYLGCYTRLEANADTLGIQRIHDYWARRYWQVGRGWINRPPGGRNDHIHLEVNETTWHWANDIDGRLTDGPPKLEAVTDTPAYPGASTKRGSSAKARVRLIQQALADKGYKVGPVDGDFGRMTDAAVRQFQGDAGEHVDGVVGPKTWTALFG